MLSMDFVYKQKYIDELQEYFKLNQIQYRIIKIEQLEDNMISLIADVQATAVDWNIVFIELMNKSFVKSINFE